MITPPLGRYNCKHTGYEANLVQSELNGAISVPAPMQPDRLSRLVLEGDEMSFP